MFWKERERWEGFSFPFPSVKCLPENFRNDFSLCVWFRYRRFSLSLSFSFLSLSWSFPSIIFSFSARSRDLGFFGMALRDTKFGGRRASQTSLLTMLYCKIVPKVFRSCSLPFSSRFFMKSQISLAPTANIWEPKIKYTEHQWRERPSPGIVH